VVDDVVTSGNSTIQAIERCRDFGLDIAQVIILVDREQSDGLQNIQRAAGKKIPVKAILTKGEIITEWRRQQDKMTPKIAIEQVLSKFGLADRKLGRVAEVLDRRLNKIAKEIVGSFKGMDSERNK